MSKQTKRRRPSPPKLPPGGEVYGVRMLRVRWFYAKFRYWNDALDYARNRQTKCDRHEVIVIVRLIAMRENRDPKGKLLPANRVVWRGEPANEKTTDGV